MKLVKSQVLLYMYEKMMRDKEININEIKVKFKLEDKTFLRYIAEIKSYIANFYKSIDLIYNRKTKKYIVKNKKNE